MSSRPHLFVYGTLMSSAHRNPFARRLREHADLIGQGRIPGRLYGLTRYPGLRPAQTAADWVAGEVYRLRRPVLVLPMLDAYEGPDYRRHSCPVALENGSTIRCWVYSFARPLPRHRRIDSGAWENNRS